MTTQSLVLLVLFLLVLLALAWPLAFLLTRVADGRRIPGMGWLAPVEKLLYRAAGVPLDAEKQGQGWKAYTMALLVFNMLGTLFVYGVQRLQAWLPLNPQGLGNVGVDSSFNTAISFAANTNWQGYVGEQTMSYFSQMVALAGQNFLSAATGIAVAFALIRGFSARSAKSIGNFWVDLTRVMLYVLLPLSFVFAVFLVGQGSIQNLSAYKEVPLVEPVTYSIARTGADGQPVLDDKGQPVMEEQTATTQTIAMGPVASQEAIKMLGTNGGGFSTPTRRTRMRTRRRCRTLRR